MKTISVLFLLFFILPVTVFSDITGLKIIANPNDRVFELKEKDIRDIYTGVKKMWDTGAKVTITILEGSEPHNRFLKEYVNKTPIQFRNFWREKVFTGEGENPKVFKDEKSLIKFVAEHRGAIGYIITASPDEKVIIVKVNK